MKVEGGAKMNNNENLDNPVEEESEVTQPLLVSMKENIYDHINVSLKTMNKIIMFLIIAIIVFTTFGIWQALIT